jgi:hypothetical protein
MREQMNTSKHCGKPNSEKKRAHPNVINNKRKLNTDDASVY